MKILILALVYVLMGSNFAVAQPAVPPTVGAAAAPAAKPTTTQPVKIRITDGTLVLTATLEDSAPAADFASMLPLSLALEDYAATEKIAYLPRKLKTTGAPAGIDPEPGDLAYYAPWGNLAIYYRDAVFANGLVRLGRLDGGVPTLERFGRTKVRIERID
ncbi:MAG: cyclophilin-like fold protein [Burkholderiaceae bacterium]|nr:cyclophilin-like fold protein [Burkholderiaceae bacterium]